MTVLFPGLSPYKTYHWDADDVHTLYIEESGNPQGLPVLFLHGGPGGSCADYNRQFFNPQHYRIIMFDQRGCGHSRPHAELKNNTTQNLIADIEMIRDRLGIEQWVVLGGSWGATLALLYAQQYPQVVLGLILRGVFLARKADIDWLFQNGAGRIFPQQWQKFVSLVDVNKQDKIVNEYYELLTGDNELKSMEAALAWAKWEVSCSALVPNQKNIERSINPFSAMSLALLECHYMKNACFIEQNQILENVQYLAHIPGIIVHGRYDMVCPIEQAVMLHDRWSRSRLNIIADAGHAATEEGSLIALVEATNSMYEKLK